MIRIKTIVLAVLTHLFFYGSPAFSQTHYLHFTTREGLPSNKVYCAVQDASGFMWFGTDNGLVRYNGSEFKTFTVKDGLPDNDIFAVFEDEHNRLWILGFKQAPCYFFKNKLYTAANDSFLSTYFGNPEMFRFAINRNKKRIVFYVVYNNQFTVLEYRNKIHRYNIPGMASAFYIKGYTLNLFNDGKSDYLINTNLFYSLSSGKKIIRRSWSISSNFDQIQLNNVQTGYYYDALRKSIISFRVEADSLKEIKAYAFEECLGPYSSPGNQMMFVFENGTIFMFDTVLNDFKVENVPLITGRVSTACIDNRGNKWLCTHDNGLYVYPLNSSKIISRKKGATSLVWDSEKRRVIAGFEDKSIQVYSGKKNQNIAIPDEITRQSRITSIIYYKDNLYIGCDNKLARFQPDTRIYHRFLDPSSMVINTIKDMELCEDGRILIGSANGASFFSIQDGRITEPLWNIRTTAVCQVRKKGVFLGTVNGLHYRPDGKTAIIPFLTGLPLDRARITDIKCDSKGRIWVGTAQFGLFIIDGSKVVRLHDQRNTNCFLTSYYIKTIFIGKEDIAWIGTNKGINRIVYGDTQNCRINRITESFCIPNDNVNAMFVNGDTVFVASLDGIYSFKFNSAIYREVPGLEITAMFVNGRKFTGDAYEVFSHDNNNIGIEYSQVAFNSAQNIEFEYRLASSGAHWIRTASNRVDLSELKPGKHRFEIKAINTISGEESPVKHLEFEIQAPWYQHPLLIACAILICGLAIWKLIANRINKVRRLSEESNRINKQFAELEMQALRAQMNPHFIFNALSAIQNYFISNKEEKANAYMASFARLIRQMLDYSKDNFIALDEEIALLSNYMTLEKMRFEQKLEFHLVIDPDIIPEDYVLPSLLLQPILENAVNHGVMSSRNDNTITLGMYLQPRHLVCEISDNGIGINASRKNKTRPDGHDSKGLKILAKRIESLNQLYSSCVTFEAADLSERGPGITGTRFVIRFPLDLVLKTTIHTL